MTGRAPAWLTARPFAHRGLHDGNRAVPENTIAAARAAIEAGFGIECDIQLSADGVPFVFHDDDLARLIGIAGDVRELDAEAIGNLRVAGTEETVPSLETFLSTVAGAVPLLVELKGRSIEADREMVAAVAAAIECYDGPLALMSFDAWLIEDCLKAGTDRPVGLTADGVEPATLERHGRIADQGCDFISYDHQGLNNEFVAGFRKRGGAVLCWTIRNEAEAETAMRHADQITFEGFLPSA